MERPKRFWFGGLGDDRLFGRADADILIGDDSAASNVAMICWTLATRDDLLEEEVSGFDELRS